MVGSILIIGDQNKQGEALKEALKKDTHFAAYLISKNGISVNAAVEKEPTLIILNPNAGYLDVMDIYYSLKKEVSVQDTPLVLLMDEKEMKTADLPSGIHEVLYRPLRISEAVARIRLLLKRTHRVDQKNLIQR